MQGVFLFIKHINVGGHTLVGRLSGIRTQSGRVTASNSATVYRHFGEAAVPAGECGPCPVTKNGTAFLNWSAQDEDEPKTVGSLASSLEA
jgi:hypothetical protein